ncbi:hypothetical protein IKS73_00100 [bacterium]|nr:hypothetical protein [bacterium]
MPKIFFIAGETSGDICGAHAVKALKALRPDLELYGIGGPEMEKAGLTLTHNITELSVIGVIEVIKHYPRIRRVYNSVLKNVKENRPDAVVFIDYPGFNLALAKKLHKLYPDLPLIYLVSPQIWAWGHSRINTIRECISLMMVMFPFEVDVYEKGGEWKVVNDTLSITEHKFRKPSKIKIKHIGHWIINKIKEFQPDPDFQAKNSIPENKELIALLPGSRENEIKWIFPTMLKSAEQIKKKHPYAFFLISCARPNLKPMLQAALQNFDKDSYRLIDESMYDIVHLSKLVLVTSGTAAFEAALMEKPILVLYYLNYISFFLARIAMKIPFINLANIIAQKRIVQEFIQYQMTPERIVPWANKYLEDQSAYDKTVSDLKAVKASLGEGDLGTKAAKEILCLLNL